MKTNGIVPGISNNVEESIILFKKYSELLSNSKVEMPEDERVSMKKDMMELGKTVIEWFSSRGLNILA